MSMFSIKLGKSKFNSYDITRRIQEMGAAVQEELSDMAHKFVNICSPWKWWYIGYCAFSKVIASVWTWHQSLWRIHANSTKIFYGSLSRSFKVYCISTTFCTAFQLFANSFSVDFKYVPIRYQLELLNLQSDDLLS